MVSKLFDQALQDGCLFRGDGFLEKFLSGSDTRRLMRGQPHFASADTFSYGALLRLLGNTEHAKQAFDSEGVEHPAKILKERRALTFLGRAIVRQARSMLPDNIYRDAVSCRYLGADKQYDLLTDIACEIACNPWRKQGKAKISFKGQPEGGLPACWPKIGGPTCLGSAEAILAVAQLAGLRAWLGTPFTLLGRGFQSEFEEVLEWLRSEVIQKGLCTAEFLDENISRADEPEQMFHSVVIIELVDGTKVLSDGGFGNFYRVERNPKSDSAFTGLEAFSQELPGLSFVLSDISTLRERQETFAEGRKHISSLIESCLGFKLFCERYRWDGAKVMDEHYHTPLFTACSLHEEQTTAYSEDFRRSLIYGAEWSSRVQSNSVVPEERRTQILLDPVLWALTDLQEGVVDSVSRGCARYQKIEVGVDCSMSVAEAVLSGLSIDQDLPIGAFLARHYFSQRSLLHGLRDSIPRAVAVAEMLPELGEVVSVNTNQSSNRWEVLYAD